jgi:tetratricopeptide repeat protein
VRAVEESLRRSIATATDGKQRSLFRVELASILRMHDVGAARDELDRAAREAGATPVIAAAVVSLARALPQADRIAWLASLVGGGEQPAPPQVVSALAAAQLGAGHAREAALTWLALASDERAALPHRRAAARRAAALAQQLPPEEARAASEAGRRLSPGRAGPRALRRSRAAPTAAVTVAEAAAPAPEAPSAAAPARRRDGRPRPPLPTRPSGQNAAAILERAVGAARAGHAGRARRLGQEAVRSGAPDDGASSAIGALESALREGGFLKEALLFRRTQLEALDREAARPALGALASEADDAGLPALAAAWRADAGGQQLGARGRHEAVTSPAARYRRAQQLLVRADGEPDLEKVLALLEGALAGHPGATDALALADRLLTRTGGDPAKVSRRRLELLRSAHAAEIDPRRRARLGARLAAELEAGGDPLGAIAVLEGGVDGDRGSDGAGDRMRAERARLLRGLNRPRDLATALAADAAALTGDARLAALAEQARLLEAAGEAEKALDVRLAALAEYPGAPAVLDEARRRLESTGRSGESLALATAALAHVDDPARRGQLLRDIATLTERGSAGAATNPSTAASAWLAVLAADPDDARAAAAAERFLIAGGEWERAAELLAWQTARMGASANQPAATGSPGRLPLLWRLAELRLARLEQPDEALRLYVEIRASRGTALPPLAASPELAALARKDVQFATETARAFVAPTPSDRSRALVDRAAVLGALGRPDDAQRDVLAAVELDPRNMSALDALQSMFDGPVRARLLAEELARRAAKLAPQVAAPLHYGRGRAAERAGNPAVARDAYRQAVTLDPTLAEPIAALGALAAREGDWSEVAALMESEVALATSPARKSALLVELAVVHCDRLGNPRRAVDLLAAVGPQLGNEARVLDLAARFNLAAGDWQLAAEALDKMAARNVPIPDAAARYHAVGAAAEAAGEIDRALTLYSRSYSRDAGFRATLERLSAICFDRCQWDNAWKATETLLERHGASLGLVERATVLARAVVAELHVAQRAAAAAKLAELVTRGPSYSPELGIRDVAESWAGMHLEPRLLAAVEPRRRERATRRAWEILRLEPAPNGTDADLAAAGEARRQATFVLGALALVEGRLADAVTALDALANAASVAPDRRVELLIASGELAARRDRDPASAAPFHDRARLIWPTHPRLAR